MMDPPLRLLDLFSGIGGFSYAAERLVGGFQTVQFVEREPFCQKVLRKHWPDVPIHDDICTYEPEPFSADVICGGFPCQDISTAGKRAGIKHGTRSGLFYELMRTVRLVRPRFVVLENVAAITSDGLGTVLGELAEAGFDAEWACIRASDVGACHRRDRWWCVAYASGTDGSRRTEGAGWGISGQADVGSGGVSKSSRGSDSATCAPQPRRHAVPADAVAYAQSERCREKGEFRPAQPTERASSCSASPAHPGSIQPKRRRATGGVAGTPGEGEAEGHQWQRDGDAADDCGADAPHPHDPRSQGRQPAGLRQHPTERFAWPENPPVDRLNPDWRSYVSEPVLCRGDDGLSGRVDRLKALGNAVVPQVAAIPLARVLGLKTDGPTPPWEA